MATPHHVDTTGGDTVTVHAFAQWAGGGAPGWLKDGAFPMEVSAGALVRLFAEGYDVMLVHAHQAQPSRREQGWGAPTVPPRNVLYVDVSGGRFRTR